MSRTALHLRRAYSDGAAHPALPNRRWTAVVLYDLRYSARVRADARRAATRPRPRAVRRAVAVYSFPRFSRDPFVAEWATVEERRARQRLRAEARAALRTVNTSGGTLDLDAADAVDIPPARHRHSARWLA